ncbi:MAG: tRNA pseudouridine(55) synthase TruB [Lachnospiraceae bacterium]|nr:tRNA pseudouridine(55) synthase TruB [Lachnospiraceae bacterium]
MEKNGILNVYKEPGFTSFDVVAKLRGIAGQRKIGHTGTLDPMATGVLPVCLGKATKVCGLLTDWDKEYEAELLLGRETDTLDVTGEVLRSTPVSVSETQVREAFSRFEGGYDQVPPMYSALKVDGKRLYDLARKGVTVERQSRPVKLYELEILEMALPVVRFRVLCSKGTYIRSLCADIGEVLGCGGCMQSLVRTKVGPFFLSDARKLSEIEARKADLTGLLRSVDALFPDLPQMRVTPEGERFLKNGNRLEAKDFVLSEDAAAFFSSQTASGAGIRVYDAAGAFAALYEYDRKAGNYKVRTMF